MIDLLTTQLRGTLENDIFNQINGLNLGISNSTARAITSRVAEETAYNVANTIVPSTNEQLTNIPQNLLGVNNPVDLVSSNNSSQSISNNLLPILQTQYSAQLTDKLVTSLENNIKTALPNNNRIINYSNIAATLAQSLTPTINSSIATALLSTTDAIFNRGFSLSSLTDAVTNNVFDLNNITQHFTGSIANKYFDQASNFNIYSTENQNKLVSIEQGFIDPEANYPTQEYAGLSETNKLAQGEIKGTVVQSKNLDRMTGAKLPGGEAWDQPESPFRGEYPYNKVTQTESGHIIEMDDTPGSERIHLYHKSGTFIEVDVNGSIVARTKGSKYEIIDRNGKISISGSADISVNGACNIFFGNDANIEVEGNTNIICHNDITAQAGGTFNLSAVEEFNIASGNVNIEAYHKMNVKSNVALLVSTTNDLSLRSNVDMYLQTATLYQNTTTTYNQANAAIYENITLGSKYTQTKENIYEKTGKSRITQSGEKISFKSTGVISADGSQVYLNSDKSLTSLDSKPSKSANVAGPSNIGIITGRKDITSNHRDDPVTPTLAETYALRLEEDHSDAQEYATHKSLIITSGFSTAQNFDKEGISIQSDSITSTQSQVITPDKKIKKYKDLPGNFNISPNFTVEMLSSKATLTKCFIQDTNNLKYGDIVYNLTAIALNVLEPAYNTFPKIVVASGYRTPDISSSHSQHPLGKCVDIQFQGATKDDYYEYAKQLAKIINYDQLILHYCNYTQTPWIHISFNLSNNRKQVMTFWNNKKYSDGISKLK